MGESILGSNGKFTFKLPNSKRDEAFAIAHLSSSHADNLKYGYRDALGCNKCPFGSTLEAALMVKSINGEITA
ncbi:MAG: hypothetical protein ACQCN6_04165 [Candidatus Bathyarchaeia archaeon]